MNLYETITICISSAAFIVSIIAIILTNNESKRARRVNYKKEYYNEIFLKYLIREVPQKRKYLEFDNISHRLINEKGLVETFTNMREEVLYYKYADTEFYKRVIQLIDDIEDYIAHSKNGTFEQEEQADFWKDLNIRFERLYIFINEYAYR